MGKKSGEECIYYPKKLQIVEENGAEYATQDEAVVDTPFYPNDATLSCFAKIVYDEGIKNENAGEILKKFNLNDWKLHSYGKNDDDHYFGAAFYNYSTQQLVISHRGTVLDRKHRRTIYTDIQGIVGNQLTSQIHSACSYTARVLQQLDQSKVHVSITGHSLGAWLAQITTFTSEYLRLNDGNKFERKNRNPNYQMHTIVFDSPGCYEMLSLISNNYHHKYEQEADSMISALDITIYFNMPNIINCCNSHHHISRLLQIFRINEERKDLTWHNVETHEMDNFVEMMQSENIKIVTVLNWPSFKFPEEAKKKRSRGPLHTITSIPKLIKLFHNTLDRIVFSSENEFKIFLEKFRDSWKNGNYTGINKKGIIIQYKSIELDSKICNLSAFSINELNFLKILEKFQIENITPERLQYTLGDNFLPNFEIKKEHGKKLICCASEEDMKKIFNRVKHIFCRKPEVYEIIKEESAKIPKIYEACYQIFSANYIRKIPEYDVDFKDTIGLHTFLQSEEKTFCLITRQRKTINEISRLRNLLQAFEVKECITPCFLSLGDLIELGRLTDVLKIFKNADCTIDQYLIIDCDTEENSEDLTLITELISAAKDSQNKKKLIVIAKKKIESCQIIVSTGPEYLFTDFKEKIIEMLLERKKVTLQRKEMSLLNFLGVEACSQMESRVTEFLSRPNVINSLISKNVEVSELCSENLLSFDDMKIRCIKIYQIIAIDRLEKFLEEINEFEKNIIFAFSGGSEWDLKKLLKPNINLDIFKFINDDSNDFYKYCRKNWGSKIYWLHLWLDSIEVREVFDSDFYVNRYFYQNIKRKGSSVEEVSSKGYQFLQESEFGQSEKKVVVIADEPGMGKSSTLLNIATQTKNTWILWINLIVFGKNVNDVPNNLNVDTIVEFLQKSSTNLSDPLIASMLRYSLLKKTSIPLVLYLDGFDEIYDDTRNKMARIFKFLKENTKARTWITTRTCAKNILEKELSIFAVKMKEITEEEQSKLITNIWQSRLMCSNEYQPQLKEIAEKLLDQVEDVLIFDQIIPSNDDRIFLKVKVRNYMRNPEILDGLIDKLGDLENLYYETWKGSRENPEEFERSISSAIVGAKIFNGDSFLESLVSWAWKLKKTENLFVQKYIKRNFELTLNENIVQILLISYNRPDDSTVNTLIGIPLQLRMISEMSQPKMIANEIEKPQFFFKDFYNMYKEFISEKIKIFLNEKLRGKMDLIDKKSVIKKHELLGFQLLFPKQAKGFLDDDEILDATDENNQQEIDNVNQIGLIQIFETGKFRFVHHSFAEFCATELIVRLLKKLQKKWSSPELENFIESDILFKQEYKMIRRFLNDSLKEDCQIFKFLNKKKCNFNKYGKTPLHMAILERNEELANVLLDNYGCLNDPACDKTDCCLSSILEDAISINSSAQLIKKMIDLNPPNGICKIKNADYPEMIMYAIYPNEFSDMTLIRFKDDNLVKIDPFIPDHEVIMKGKLDFSTESNLAELMLFAINDINLDLFKKLMKDFPEECRKIVRNKEDTWGERMLESAIPCKDKEILEGLLDIGADINGAWNQDTPLLTALGCRYWDKAEILIDRGADVNIPTLGSDVTPIQIAAQNGASSIIPKLLSKGAKLDDIPDEFKLAPIHAAVARHEWDIVLELIDCYTDGNIILDQDQIMMLMSILSVCKGEK